MSYTPTQATDYSTMTTLSPKEDSDTKYDMHELANTLKARLQYAQLKVKTGMADKNMQQVEAAFKKAYPPTPSSPQNTKEDEEQEAAAARTIMLMSSACSPYTQYHYAAPGYPYSPYSRPLYFEHDSRFSQYPPSFHEYVAQDPAYDRKSKAVGKTLPRRGRPPNTPRSTMHSPAVPTSSWLHTAPYNPSAMHYSPYHLPPSSPRLAPVSLPPPYATDHRRAAKFVNANAMDYPHRHQPRAWKTHPSS